MQTKKEATVVKEAEKIVKNTPLFCLECNKKPYCKEICKELEAHMEEVELDCPVCCGTGEDLSNPPKKCSLCEGTGRITKKAYLLPKKTTGRNKKEIIFDNQLLDKVTLTSKKYGVRKKPTHYDDNWEAND